MPSTPLTAYSAPFSTPAASPYRAAGNPAWIVHVYSLLNVAAWLALAVLLWRLLAVQSARGWLAWAGVLFSTGALSSVRLALTDLVALAILTGALLAAERGRRGWALGSVAAAGLARAILAQPRPRRPRRGAARRVDHLRELARRAKFNRAV